MRQCDKLDGLADGIINNYMALPRDHSTSTRGASPASVGGEALPWQRRSQSLRHQRRRLPHGRPDLDARVRLHPLQVRDAAGERVEDIRHVGAEHRSLRQRPDPAARFRGQEGAAADAPMHSHLGALGVTGFLMKDVSANPLDYVEGGALNRAGASSRRGSIPPIPTSFAFAQRGGKMIVAIGTNDTLASPGCAARLLPVRARQDGTNAGRSLRPLLRAAADGPRIDRDELRHERRRTSAPGRSGAEYVRPSWSAVRLGRTRRGSWHVGHGDGGESLPLCSYPTYPRYISGPAASSSSYRCEQR